MRVIGNAVVLWQEPAEPDGIITGYEVGISTTQAPELIPIIRDISDPEQNYYVIKSDDASTPTVYIQVRMDEINVMHLHNLWQQMM